MSEPSENVIRRIENKFAALTDEVVRLRADRELLARELHRVRNERDRLLAELSRVNSSAPADAGLTDADWERLSGNL